MKLTPREKRITPHVKQMAANLLVKAAQFAIKHLYIQQELDFAAAKQDKPVHLARKSDGRTEQPAIPNKKENDKSFKALK